jgi:16S rRNA (cytidine1402-2'-O)-methyltransferase
MPALGASRSDGQSGRRSSATLYVVATPLGNLEDLTARAARVLREVPVVAAEDTRRARKLLSHLDAHPRLVSYHAHSDDGRATALIQLLLNGEDVALVSDAGTPAVSDPGAVLVQAAREAGISVVPVAGPSAVAAALSASGIAGDRFLFLGFLPRKGPERARLLRQAATCEWTLVLYEAPHRLLELLQDLAAATGDGRRAIVGRELTKVHEEFRTGTLAELAAHWAETEPRGECTVVVEGTGPVSEVAADPDLARKLARDLLDAGHSRKEIARDVAERTGLSRNEAYRLVMELA